MPTIDDIKDTDRIMALLISPPGGGKTILCASMGEDDPPKSVYFFDCDLRMKPIRKMRHLFPNAKISYDSYGPADFEKLWKAAQNIAKNDGLYDWVILDSLTALARMNLNYSTVLRGQGDNAREGKRKGVIDLLEIEDFGAEGRGIGYLLDLFRGMRRTNFILTAHLIRVAEKDLKSKTITNTQTLLTGGKKIAAEIPSYFDEVWFIGVEPSFAGEPERWLWTVPVEDIMCKTALPLPPRIKIDGLNAWQEMKKYLNFESETKGGETEANDLNELWTNKDRNS